MGGDAILSGVWGLIRGEIWHETLGYWGRRLIQVWVLGILHQATHFYLEEVLRWSVDLLEGLLSRFWDGLQLGGVGVMRMES